MVCLYEDPIMHSLVKRNYSIILQTTKCVFDPIERTIAASEATSYTGQCLSSSSVHFLARALRRISSFEQSPTAE